MRRRLAKAGFKVHVAAQKDFLKEKHVLARMRFAELYVGRSLSFWRGVVFSDEKSFGYSLRVLSILDCILMNVI